ncbi:TonB-dependent receptor [Gramella sp. GC03-9]|uniref:TonB-dependent receptor n=1 Tax=Christiangramia oceanisediminis TaxID=2920386 RepID=A0A9X2KVL8_9FLAO|nr:TonB-dependent receptor [Gramella oceanisediminis]MCP9198840.1 TonB-dependent receptor [Gramella oceanisediminis]
MFAQGNELSGIIFDENNEPVMGINVFFPEIGKGAISDESGQYVIRNIPNGRYRLMIEGMGFKGLVRNLEFKGDENFKIDFVLQESSENLGEIQIIAKTEAENIRETAFEVSVIETTQYKNLSGDINTLLRTSPGINIRETGGLGSDFSLSLNGLSGNQVRFFIDGIPMENFGSSLSLNNFPINLVENIQVYKGVVPINLGADALGGAVNITTSSRKNSFLDASYTSGSFNTHRVALNGQYSNEEARYYLRFLSFFNHSDNDYEMKAVPLYDLELGNYFGEISTDRFHSEYTSGMGKLQFGLFDRTWADEIAISATFSKNRNNQQHPSNNIIRVFGDFHTRAENKLIDVRYLKEWDKLRLSAYALYGEIEQQTIDTSKYRYNWEGDRILRSAQDMRGELFNRRSHIFLDDEIIRSNLQAGYDLTENHNLDASITQNSVNREGYDPVNEFNTAIEFPNALNKYILGLGYNFRSNNQKWNASLFTKQYLFDADISTNDFEDNVLTNTTDLSRTGFGVAATYFINTNFQVKTSYENAVRLPETYEILGDGIYTNPNPTLEPELSDNFNLGLRYRSSQNTIRYRTEANFFLRNSTDFIRFRPVGPFGQFENLSSVRSLGGEFSGGIDYSKVSLDLNATYQHITDQTKTDEGLPNVNYQSRVPNIPYFFGNLRAGYEIFENDNTGTFQLYWNTHYVHEFFLNWENLGSADTKPIIPAQFANDLEAEFSSVSGKYNISFSLMNIFDEELYDNFRIQKPGRAFYLKLRYNLN